MRYSLFAGGKRLRPILAIMGYELAGGQDVENEVLPQAAALELIHTFTLIHDDLPAMDDDDYRRGKLSNHKVFGEGIAILAGDTLLVEAFRLFLQGTQPPDVKIEMMNELIDAIGIDGVMGGQAVDLQSEGKKPTEELVRYIHTRKTGRFIRAALVIGGIASRNLSVVEPYRKIGENIGLAFQIADDILDEIGDEATVGKKVHKDRERGKCTYTALYGVAKARSDARRLVDEAIGIARSLFGEDAWPIVELANFIVERTY